MQNCWICGALANTSEHKIKRSDLVRTHGDGMTFSRAGLTYLTNEGKFIRLQGPNSKYVKYKNVICSFCNNQGTQRADFAYDHFITYMENNRDNIISRRQINFRNIYGTDWPVQQLELFRYFTKAFGCRIAEVEHTVPEDFRNVLSQSSFVTGLWICVAVNEDIIQSTDTNQPVLKVGHLITNQFVDPANQCTNLPKKYASAHFYKWLIFTYWYGWGPFGPVGGRWCADLEYLHLGSFTRAESMMDIPRDDGTSVTWPGFQS